MLSAPVETMSFYSRRNCPLLLINTPGFASSSEHCLGFCVHQCFPSTYLYWSQINTSCPSLWKAFAMGHHTWHSWTGSKVASPARPSSHWNQVWYLQRSLLLLVKLSCIQNSLLHGFKPLYMTSGGLFYFFFFFTSWCGHLVGCCFLGGGYTHLIAHFCFLVLSLSVTLFIIRERFHKERNSNLSGTIKRILSSINRSLWKTKQFWQWARWVLSRFLLFVLPVTWWPISKNVVTQWPEIWPQLLPRSSYRYQKCKHSPQLPGTKKLKERGKNGRRKAVSYPHLPKNCLSETNTNLKGLATWVNLTDFTCYKLMGFGCTCFVATDFFWMKLSGLSCVQGFITCAHELANLENANCLLLVVTTKIGVFKG